MKKFGRHFCFSRTMPLPVPHLLAQQSDKVRFTADGRKRAPQLLYGQAAYKRMPWLKIGAAVVVLAAYRWYNEEEALANKKPHQRVLDKLVLRPYGVLGTQLSLQGSLHEVAALPGPDVCIIDPAGLHHIQGTPEGAGGAAAAIYNFLKLNKKEKFPEDVLGPPRVQLRHR
jgi:hypothetical protein